jgi:hypothetical protein
VTRFQQAAVASLADAPVIERRLLLDIGVTSGTVYACNGDRFLFTFSNTYSPVGGLGSVSAIQEEADVFPRDVTITLRGVNSSDLYEPLREDMFNRPVTIRHAFLTNGTLVNTPETIWRGRVNAVNVRLEDAEFDVKCVTDVRKTARVQYFNRETFTLIDSSDTFGAHIDRIPLFRSEWGQRPTTYVGGGVIDSGRAGESGTEG